MFATSSGPRVCLRGRVLGWGCDAAAGLCKDRPMTDCECAQCAVSPSMLNGLLEICKFLPFFVAHSVMHDTYTIIVYLNQNSIGSHFDHNSSVHSASFSSKSNKQNSCTQLCRSQSSVHKRPRTQIQSKQNHKCQPTERNKTMHKHPQMLGWCFSPTRDT